MRLATIQRVLADCEMDLRVPISVFLHSWAPLVEIEPDTGMLRLQHRRDAIGRRCLV